MNSNLVRLSEIISNKQHAVELLRQEYNQGLAELEALEALAEIRRANFGSVDITALIEHVKERDPKIADVMLRAQSLKIVKGEIRASVRQRDFADWKIFRHSIEKLCSEFAQRTLALALKTINEDELDG